MPEYLAPGVYVEEVSFRSKSIEGLSTTTTGFIGPTRYGPVDQPPPLLTSVGDFERVYGDRNQMNFNPTDPTSLMHNYMWHAVNAFFVEGGQRLYVMRVFSPFVLANNGGDPVLSANGTFTRGTYAAPSDDGLAPVWQSAEGLYADGHARYNLQAAGDNRTVHIRARYPGSAGNMRLRFTLRVGQNVLSGGDPIPGRPGTFTPKVGALQDKDIVWIDYTTSPLSSPLGTGELYRAERYFDAGTKSWTWRFHLPTGSPAHAPLELTDFVFNLDPQHRDHIRVVTLTVTLVQSDGTSLVWSGLAFDPNHTQNGLRDSVLAKFDTDLNNTLPVVITSGGTTIDGLDVLYAMFTSDFLKHLDPDSSDLARSVDILLVGGNDGLRPGDDAYQGAVNPITNLKTGLKAFEDLDEISIIAAPGSTYGYEREYRSEAHAIINLLIAHAEQMRYLIAIIDSADGQSITNVLSLRGQINSSYAALYYPWILEPDPATQLNIYIPPSGSVAGIYARNDINRAVYKAPANEPVLTAIGFEFVINKAQQEVLNPVGVNCFRTFENGGLLLWGARTATNDPEWKYVNLRRYFAYLEHSIDRGTQWAVFEPNGEALWAKVRSEISDFLLNEWQSGALLGDKPENSYFVRCDRSTMSQNDIDNGRLVCLIGVAALRPAEFVIFRIGQWTGDRRS